MAQHSLNRPRGSVAIETLLCMPMMLFFLTVVVYADARSRSSWSAQMGARLATEYNYYTQDALSNSQLLRLLRQCDEGVGTCGASVDRDASWADLLFLRDLRETAPRPSPIRIGLMRSPTSALLTTCKVKMRGYPFTGVDIQNHPGGTGSGLDSPLSALVDYIPYAESVHKKERRHFRP